MTHVDLKESLKQLLPFIEKARLGLNFYSALEISNVVHFINGKDSQKTFTDEELVDVCCSCIDYGTSNGVYPLASDDLQNIEKILRKLKEDFPKIFEAIVKKKQEQSQKEKELVNLGPHVKTGTGHPEPVEDHKDHKHLEPVKEKPKPKTTKPKAKKGKEDQKE